VVTLGATLRRTSYGEFRNHSGVDTSAKTYIEIRYEPAVWVTAGQTADPQLSYELLLQLGSKPSVAVQSLNEGEMTELSTSHSPTIVSPDPKLSPSEGLVQVGVHCALPTRIVRNTTERYIDFHIERV
jgi:hypothetical protein